MADRLFFRPFPVHDAGHVRMAIHWIARSGPGCVTEEVLCRVANAARLHGVDLPPGWEPAPLKVVMHEWLT